MIKKYRSFRVIIYTVNKLIKKMANKVNITIGRFQPFTQGHLNMIIEGEAPCIVYRINSSKADEDTSKIKVKGKVVKKDEIKHATLPIRKRRNIFMVSAILCFVIFIILLIGYVSHSEKDEMTSWSILLTGIGGFLLLICMGHEDSLIDDKRNEIIDRELNRQSKV